jgi:hypothetical protein
LVRDAGALAQVRLHAALAAIRIHATVGLEIRAHD